MYTVVYLCKLRSLAAILFLFICRNNNEEYCHLFIVLFALCCTLFRYEHIAKKIIICSSYFKENMWIIMHNLHYACFS